MSTPAYSYDIDQFLVSSTRQLEAYTRDNVQGDPALGTAVEVEMSFPDTSSWTKDTPLTNSIVHFDLDDAPAMLLGFGVTGFVDEPDDDGAAIVHEAHLHHLNFDIGVWVSAESGGTTKRMQIRQALMNLFGTSTGRINFRDQTDGLQIVRFGGGADVLDRINDVPLWRTSGIELVISVFGRLTKPDPVYVVQQMEQRQKLSTVTQDEHVSTDEDPWT